MTAPIQLLRAALPHFRAQGGGRFIQNTTMGAHLSTAGGSLHHAAKWGVEGFLESVIGEVEPLGITMIEPGMVRTGFSAAMSIADGLDAYAAIRTALTDRLDELDAGKSLAASTDFPQ